MTTADIAIIISIISVAIAGLSLGWNIYRDVVLKAKIKIGFGVRMIIQHGNPARPEYVNITATNHGPGSVNLSMVQMKDSSWWRWLLRKEKYAAVMHDYTNPLSGQLPYKLEVAEKIDLLFHYNADCMLKNGWSHIGISDYFGRTHWAKSKQVKEAISRWNKDFGKVKYQTNPLKGGNEMTRNKMAAISLFLASFAIILGFILNIETYWFITDVLVIIICAANGIMLLKNK